MPQLFDYAETVEAIAQGLIPVHHPELATARFKYIFQEKAGKKGGKAVYGVAKKVSGVTQFLTDTDFLIVIGQDLWIDLTEEKRIAVIDHLLERCTGVESEKDGGMVWTTREPDVHEFATILRRHGTWNDDLTQFMSVAAAMTTEDETEVETVGN